MDWRRTILVVTLALATSFGLNGSVFAQEDIKLGGRRIVGGAPTDIQNHLWQVAINIKRTEGTYLCGGSLVAQNWVLSAAHCFRASDQLDAVRVKAGATNYIDQGIWSDVTKVVIHENYNSKTHEHDLSMVKFRMNPLGRVIPLVQAASNIPVNQPLEVTGWGTTTEGGQISKTLLQAAVPYVDNNTCNEPASYNGRVLPGMMCAGHRDGEIDSCQGDSGGPLVWKTGAGPILVGVVSFGDGCARKLKYGVYTRVGAYREWINGVLAADR